MKHIYSNPMTLQEISDYFGVSRERIRQIEQKALLKVRKALYKKGIFNYSDISIGELFNFADSHLSKQKDKE